MTPAFRTLRARAARLFVLLALAIASVAALVTWTTGAGHWVIELGRFVPYPAFLAPALAAVLVSWWLGRAWRLAALLALGLVVGPVMGWSFGRADTGFDRVRVMSFNIKSYLATKKFGGFSEIAAEIDRHAPDLIVMQDAQALGDEPTNETVRKLQQSLRGREVFAAGEYIVASRFPMRDCRVEDLSYGTHERQYVRCTVRAHGTDMDLVTAHFISPRDGLNATRYERIDGLQEWKENFARRIEQSRKLALGVARRPRPMIVAGDLNAAESSPVVQGLLKTGLRDAFSSAGTGFGYTHGHSLRLGFSFLRIDHILVSADIGVQDCFVGEPDASDHRPVIADLWITPGGNRAIAP
ncbi:MAG: endonuclease/exonuclease/phosphatase family protein [Burkholderiaceae bacterium]